MTPDHTTLTPPGANHDAPFLLLLRQHLAPLAAGGLSAALDLALTALCQALERGDVCVPLRAGADELPVHRRDLLASGLVGTGADGEAELPLVLDAKDRLYLRRDFRAERAVASFVAARLQQPPRHQPAALAAALQACGEAARPGPPDWQLAAIAAAARSSFAVLCGGPGTGKTTTVVRLLQVLLQLEPGLTIAIAAPTGKATARLGEALRQRAPAMPALAAALPSLRLGTLHRLLGYLPLDDRFRAGPEQPLPFDCVVVDEVSMVDPTLLAALLQALRPEARLLLVGDQDQLAAIAAGQVLGDLCRAARPERGVGAELATFVAAATGMALPVQTAASPLADVTITLRDNHRFGGDSGIGAFAAALMRRDAPAAAAALAQGREDLVVLPDADAAMQHIGPALAAMRTAADRGDAAAALAAIGRARVLTASRHGAAGAAAWNARIEAWLAAAGHRLDDPWYTGRPLLVTSNDYQNRVWNGDLGVVGRDAAGNPVVWFAAADGSVRTLSPRRLPPHETAWAMTVHKAQGSEFDEVLLVMPEGPSPLWQATLVYTGITRARRRAALLADRALLLPCLSHWPQRGSGLVDHLSG